MKSKDLKQVLKPLIKECVKEMMIEEGFLSSVISEVIKGMNVNVIAESRPSEQNSQEQKWKRSLEEKMEQERQERIQKLNESMEKKHKINIFEGVTPAPESAEQTQGGALAGQDPNDAGVDISGILNVAGGTGKWKALAGGLNV